MNEKVLRGLSVSPGIARGKICLVKTYEDIEKVQQGDIIVLPQSHPVYTMALMKAGAVICEIGGRLSHICVVSMEMGIPCITQVDSALKILKNGQHVYMDAYEGVIIIDE